MSKSKKKTSPIEPRQRREFLPAPEKTIGTRIREKREGLGMNFEQLSALTREYDAEGIAAVTLRRYEREEGGTLPGLRELRILCDALDVSSDYLLRGQAASELELRDRADWKDLKAILLRVVDAVRLPSGITLEVVSNFGRQEALKRARLHTKPEK